MIIESTKRTFFKLYMDLHLDSHHLNMIIIFSSHKFCDRQTMQFSLLKNTEKFDLTNDNYVYFIMFIAN